MKSSTRVITKTPKKRASETGTLVGVRLQPDLLQALDAWRRKQKDPPSRPDAIRNALRAWLIEQGLIKKGTTE